MLIIPLDGPPLEHRDVLVFTTGGTLRGTVTAETPTHVHLVVDDAERVLDRNEIHTIVTI